MDDFQKMEQEVGITQSNQRQPRKKKLFDFEVGSLPKEIDLAGRAEGFKTGRKSVP